MKKENKLYFSIGVGCGVILSGCLMIFVGFKSSEELESLKTAYGESLQTIEKTYNEQLAEKSVAITEESVEIEKEELEKEELEKEELEEQTDYPEAQPEEVVEIEEISESQKETEILSEQELLEVEVQEQSEENTNEVGVVEETQEDVVQMYKWVDIPWHYGSKQIAQFLGAHEIVEDVDAFYAYIHEKSVSRILLTGRRYMPINGDYEEIIAILTGKKQ